VVDSSSGRVAEPKATQGEIKRHSWLAAFWLRMVREKPLGMVGVVITVILLVTGIFADFIAPYGMNQTHTDFYMVGSSAKFWLGTDNLGRDILSRVIFGARISVIIGVAASALSTINSAFIGILCGYIGGKLDLIVQRFVDAWMCLPGLIVLMIVISFIGPGMLTLIISMGILGGIGGSRIVRSAVIAVKGNVYVSAAEAIGCSTTRMLTRHILPNVMAPIIILFSLRVPGVILTEASLSFLGFGIPPPFPSWGGMLSGSGRAYMFVAPWMVLWPGIALGVVVYGLNMFGDAVRDILDPRLRGGVGRYGTKQSKEEVPRKK